MSFQHFFVLFSQEVQHKVLKYFQLKPKVNSLRNVYEVSLKVWFLEKRLDKVK